MLIGWSQAFPHHDIISENEVMKEVEREIRDVVSALLSCGNTILEVTYIMTDGAGSGIDHVQVAGSGLDSSNFTQYNNPFALFWHLQP